MIVFDLSCDNGHAFEGWFGSSDDFADQKSSGLLTCPQCGSAAVSKAPMAPSVGKKGNQQVATTSAAKGKGVSNSPMAPEVAEALGKLAKAQAKALEDSTWVGKDFAEESRAMHYGEKDHAAIHGEASMQEAKELLDEGVAVAPLPLPIAKPDKVN